MRNIKCVIAYDGSGFSGWQIQAGVRTVQGVLEQALCVMLKHNVRLVASGRTDAGVHALGQVVNFTTDRGIPLHGLHRGLNALLPEDISVVSVEEVPMGFHARFSAKSKTYVYVFLVSPVKNPLLARYAFHTNIPLDAEAMAQAAGYLVGEHDFSSFMAAGSAVKTAVRRMAVCDVIRRGERICLVMEGSGFLRHMVRNVAGTLFLVGAGKLSPGDVKAILGARERCRAGPTAPPQGLYLVRVTY